MPSTPLPTAFLSMKRLGELSGETLEKAGKEPTSSSGYFNDRTGYSPGFLDGWEIPVPMPADDICLIKYGSDKGQPVLKYEHFSVVMSASRRMPAVTAVNIDGTASLGHPRIKIWYFDGRLDKEDQWGDALYDSNAVDRGHMVRREDPIWGDPSRASVANKDTFHFTNSCPQMEGVNQKTWVGLENYVLHNARSQGMKVSVFTGPFFTEKDLEYRGALVPLSFWKVVAIVTEDGRRSATAYIVSQEKELRDLEFTYGGYKTFQVSIRQVKEATNIDFGDLAEYDGFSLYESATGNVLKENVENPGNIRV